MRISNHPSAVDTNLNHGTTRSNLQITLKLQVNSSSTLRSLKPNVKRGSDTYVRRIWRELERETEQIRVASYVLGI